MKKKIYLTALISVFIDQLTKMLISINMKPFTGKTIIKGFFDITYVQNKGAAWGILNNNLPVLIFISMAAIFLLNSYINKEQKETMLLTISYGLLMGGIIGNLIDRVFKSYVVDFLNFYIFNYNYPVFNLADTFIIIGILLMVVEIIRGDINEHKSGRRTKKN